MKKKPIHQEYQSRIHRLQDYIEAHPEKRFTAEELAQIAGMSKYHFHRIFKSMTGESLYEYITRVKMEESLGLILNRLDLSITDIAYELGFSDSAVFSRTFKTYYDVSPLEVRKDSNNRKVFSQTKQHNENVETTSTSVRGTVSIKTIPDTSVLYKRFTGSYQKLYENTNVFGELYEFALQNGFLNDQSIPLTIYHNDSELTPESYLRTSHGLSIKDTVHHVEDTTYDVMVIPSGLYGVIHFGINQSDYPGAWEYVYGEWLLSSGYIPRNSHPFEVYLNNPLEHPNHLHLVDIYIPIEPLR